MACGKLIDEDKGITCVDGEWVCDTDTCRILDENNDAHVAIDKMYVTQPDRDITIKGGWKVVAVAVEDMHSKITRDIFGYGLPKYNITAYDPTGDEVGKSTGCLGNSALEFWWKHHVDRVRRLAILTEDLAMAQHNARCYYSKPEYQNEYNDELARVEILNEWIDKIKSDKL
jgi:hypothetical protein